MKRRMHDASQWQAEAFATLPVEARLLLLALVDSADDQGRFRAHAAAVRSQAFPYDDFTLAQVDAWMNALTSSALEHTPTGPITLYQVEGQTYGQFRKWWDIQRPSWAGPSQLPPPPEWDDRIRIRGPHSVLTYNWQDVKGLLLPNSCDRTGKPTPIPTVIGIPIGTPIPTGNGTPKPIEEEEEEEEVERSIESAQSVKTTGTLIDLDALMAPPPKRHPVFSAYESSIGMLTPMVQDAIQKTLKDTPEDWIVEAIGITKEQADRPSWAYVNGILTRWKTEGKPSGSGKKSKAPSSAQSLPATTETYFTNVAEALGITVDEAKRQYYARQA